MTKACVFFSCLVSLCERLKIGHLSVLKSVGFI